MGLLSLQRGAHAESKALSYLKQNGLTLIEQNYRCRSGEIDLIMMDTNSLVFIEVKQRTSGNPLWAVTPAKQKKIIRTAEYFLIKKRIASTLNCRFDVVTFNASPHQPPCWIQNAFQVQ